MSRSFSRRLNQEAREPGPYALYGLEVLSDHLRAHMGNSKSQDASKLKSAQITLNQFQKRCIWSWRKRVTLRTQSGEVGCLYLPFFTGLEASGPQSIGPFGRPDLRKEERKDQSISRDDSNKRKISARGQKSEAESDTSVLDQPAPIDTGGKQKHISRLLRYPY
ncbi:hypothetical protein E1B28_002309 [Marasmius oreades]|uniref:Uncharacterized protein n=1 Tax=Marasmius oreades TaxID=181124 RepID=A0A9P7RNB5_9AGAR|nr:uncharacterized protein E1B28_002309 [Marasmius oreades]KAG7086348.1 hypothetical protein E1B28_002309 [Marasmius oreades]